MAISEQQLVSLTEKLDPARVKQRKQAGLSLDFIEGWDSIGTANRIFGFDGWSTTLLSLKHVGTDEITNNENKQGWFTLYEAQVRVDALGTWHMDVGYGNDTGYRNELATHEMAGKEAVTDALKRTLKNFGDQFGLTLYDKAKTNVATTSEVTPEQAARYKKDKAPKQARKSKPTGELEEATPEEVVAYTDYLIAHGATMEAVNEHMKKPVERYGFVPKDWVEAQLTQAKLKAGESLE